MAKLQDSALRVAANDPAQQASIRELGRLLDRSCSEMLGFTGELRAKISQGDQAIEAFDLRELLRNLAGSLRTAFAVDIATDLPATPWMPGGPGVHIQVQLRADAEAVHITISNDGPPIPACADCRFGQACRDQKCANFTIGKTSKEGGGGTGVVSVIATLKQLAGSLRIAGVPQGHYPVRDRRPLAAGTPICQKACGWATMPPL